MIRLATKAFVLFWLLFPRAALQAQPTEERELLPITARVVTNSPGHRIVEFVLENHSAEPVKLPRARLPWDLASATFAVVVQHVHYSLKRDIGIRDNFDIEDVVIEPGASFRGGFNLGDQFFEIDDMLRKHDVVFFWYLNWQSPRNGRDIPCGGYLVLNRDAK